MKSICQSIQKLLSRNNDRHTDMCKTFTYPLSRAVKIINDLLNKLGRLTDRPTNTFEIRYHGNTWLCLTMSWPSQKKMDSKLNVGSK